MDKSVIKFVGIGFGLYAIFATLVITFYEDDTDQMGWEDRQAFNQRFISALSIEENIDRSYVIQTLGSPDLTEAKLKGEISFQVMFYRTQHTQSDGITTKDECTPMLFENGQLVAWGDVAYEQFTNI